MVTFHLSEQDYLELQETVLAYSVDNSIDEDIAYLKIDEFLSYPENKADIALFIWQALTSDELGLVSRNPQLKQIKSLARIQFCDLETNSLIQ